MDSNEIQKAEATVPAVAASDAAVAIVAAPPTEKPKRVRAKKAEQPKAEAAAPVEESGAILLFGKYSYDVQVADLSLKNYINLKPIEYPNTFRRESGKMFSKSSINIVERLENTLMRGGTGGKISGKVIRTKGRLQGKKLKVMHFIENAFERISSETNENPLQVYIRALENSAPIEDTTRVRYGGIISNVAVDISASRRLDIALRNISIAVVLGAFRNKKTFEDALTSELILAGKNDVNSYAIKRKNEIERMARSAK
jgi:small subunit ribosomal protein S7